MVPNRVVEEHLSAGGIVYRTSRGGIEIVLCGRSSQKLWALPKGTPEAGEAFRETAIREVQEETGLEAAVGPFVGVIEYCFVLPNSGVTCHKRVYFFLMTVIGGDTSLHDNEFDTVEWFAASLALATMTYDNEVRVAEKGIAMAQRAN